MPAADDRFERPTLTADEGLGGMAYYAAASAPRADDTDLDRELVKLLAGPGKVSQLRTTQHPTGDTPASAVTDCARPNSNRT